MKLKHDELLSNFAFNFNLRHYTKAAEPKAEKKPKKAAKEEKKAAKEPKKAAKEEEKPKKPTKKGAFKAGRCRLTPGLRS